MAAALDGRAEERVDDALRELVADGTLAHREEVHIDVLDRVARRPFVVDDRGADPRDLVRGDRRADARAAAKDRALELPALQRAAIWGCGNFELNWPGYLYVNRRALREKRLALWPWTERLKASGRRRWLGLTSEDWRGQFSAFAGSLARQNIYVTVDLDCLREGEAVTNWEQGLFTAADICWAIGEMSRHATITGGDLCGGYSEQRYARGMQRLFAKLDHPQKNVVASEAAERNANAFRTIWSALTQRHDRHTRADEQHAEP